MRTPRRTLLGTWLLVAATAGWAQDVTKEQNKLLAKRAAEADAYRKLAEIVYGLQINSHTYVKDFVTESDDIRSNVDTFIKGIRFGSPTWFEDGSCEIPAEVTVAKVVETLRSAHDRYYKGDSVKTSDFDTMTKRIEKNVIKVVGTGSPRPDLPPNLPQGAAEQLGPPPGNPPKPPIPDIWLKIGSQAKNMALRAAELDAKRKLAERIKGLRLTAKTQVRDFVAESDVINAELNAFLVGAETVGEYLHPDELIAEVTIRVPTEQVITTIKELHSRHYKGDELKGHDIEDVVKTVVKKDFEATGMGVPPPQYLRRYAETTGAALPEWSMGPIEVEGLGTDPEINTAQGRLKAILAAELDGKRKLAEKIAGLKLQGDTLVREFMTKHDEISAQIEGVLVNAVVTRSEIKGDTAVVTVQVPGMQVWGVINEPLQREAKH